MTHMQDTQLPTLEQNWEKAGQHFRESHNVREREKNDMPMWLEKGDF